MLARVGAPPVETWPKTVAERDQLVRDLESATSEVSMAAVWAGRDAVNEALGRIEWLLAPGDGESGGNSHFPFCVRSMPVSNTYVSTIAKLAHLIDTHTRHM